MALGTGGRTITKVDTGVIKDGTLTLSKFATTGTASATTVLYGNMAWASGSPTGKRDFTDTNATPAAGDVWFESDQLKFAAAPGDHVGTWSSANLISQTLTKVSSTGTQNAGLRMGGMYGWDEGTQSGVTEEYNGSTWSTSGSLQTARSAMSRAGTQSAALCAGGSNYGGSSGSYSMNNSEEYDGTSWASGNNLATGTQSTSGDGTQSAAWCAGGYQNSNNATNTQIYDGTSWANQGGTLNTGRQYMNGCGTTSAGLIVGGRHDYVNTTEEWDGTSWAYGGNVNFPLWYSGVFGTQTAATSATGQKGGSVPSGMIPGTEEYDGTSWSNTSNVITPRMTSGNGSQSMGMIVAGEAATQTPGGGNSNLGTSVVEEYNKGSFSWSSV